MWILCRKYEKEQPNYIFMISSVTFLMPNWHFGAYLIKLGHFYEEIGLTRHTFRKGTFQGSSIARQIYHLDSWNLVQNCPTASSFRTISHCLPIISYIAFRTLNVRESYPYPKILNFEQYAIVWILCRTTKLHIYAFFIYICNTWFTFWSIICKIGPFL